mmetsp:Transcript_103244/g.291958  ORF Transcript_103244/g.291958 Transcript_103244/m.291958 type:complete len:213 (+) Transcript_103244:255-893(+)
MTGSARTRPASITQRWCSGKKSTCPSCGTARNAKHPGDWACPNTDCLNHRNTVFASKANCPKCGQERPSQLGAAPQAAQPAQNGWATQQLLQQFQMPQFQMQLQGMQGMQGHGANGGNPNDWRCPNTACVNNRRMVFAKNMACPQCGAPKETAVLGHGKGGANPGDWQCPNTDCVNHRNKVFAKHMACPSCGMEKPEELRTRSRSPFRGMGV